MLFRSRIHAAFGSIEEDEVLAMKAEDGLERLRRKVDGEAEQ